MAATAEWSTPLITTTTSLDYAETSPGTLVRVGNVDSGSTSHRIAFSTDDGANWFQGAEPSGVTGGGTVAAASDGSRFLWSPAGPASTTRSASATRGPPRPASPRAR